ncbi:hypothetical protein J2805_004088 [Arthrobacter oryzae]|nr:hypothetical protein [Arthrobacter oryzae]
MSTWPQAIDRIAASDDLHIAPFRADGATSTRLSISSTLSQARRRRESLPVPLSRGPLQRETGALLAVAGPPPCRSGQWQ